MPAATHNAIIERTTSLSPHVREIMLCRPDAPLSFQPGQWISLHLPVGEKPPLVRAYSLARPEETSGALTLCLDRVPDGLGSGYLFERQAGDPIALAGPLGNFVLPEPLETDLLFVARFTGIVPIRCMLLALSAQPFSRLVRLVYGAPAVEELIYHQEFLDLAAREPRFEYYPTLLEPPVHTSTTSPWTGDVEEELDLLARHAAGWMPFVPMVCGLREFTRSVRAFFQEMGFERRAVRLESYN
jgi:phenol hydroxylase P5 protein